MRYIEKDLSKKVILITGGAGFIGSNLAFHFQEHYPDTEIVVFDRFQDGKRLENGNPISLGHFKNLLGFRGEIITGDITNREDLEKLFSRKFDYIFHQAAISDTTATNQKLVMETNVDSFRSILEYAERLGSKVIYASSGAVYGNSPSPQKVGNEEPKNIYGFSKLVMDNLSRRYFDRVEIVGLRYFNVYGAREFFKGKTASMVLQFGLQILSGQAPRLFEGSDKIFRDFIYIEDVIQANIRAIEGEPGIYNVGTGIARSFQDIADILQTELETDYGNEYIPNPYTSQYQFFTQADIRETQQKLGYSPRFSLEDGIRDYIDEIKRIYVDEVEK